MTTKYDPRGDIKRLQLTDKSSSNSPRASASILTYMMLIKDAHHELARLVMAILHAMLDVEVS